MGSLGPTAMALLSSKVLPVTVSVPDEVSSMPPPNPPPAAVAEGLVVVQRAIADAEGSAVLDDAAAPRSPRPSLMVSPAMLTLRLPPMSKTRLALSPLTVSWSSPGPSIVRLLAEMAVAACQLDGAVKIVGEVDHTRAGGGFAPTTAAERTGTGIVPGY